MLSVCFYCRLTFQHYLLERRAVGTCRCTALPCAMRFVAYNQKRNSIQVQGCHPSVREMEMTLLVYLYPALKSHDCDGLAN